MLSGGQRQRLAIALNSTQNKGKWAADYKLILADLYSQGEIKDSSGFWKTFRSTDV